MKRVLGIGAAVSVLVGVFTVVVINNVGAASVASSVTPITPCRLVDTRAAAHVGEKAGPLGQGETVTLNVVGTHGNCTIPSGATGIVANVTIDLPTAAGFLTLFPADAALPLASNLNWVAGQAPTPNQVSVGLSASGAINVFNNAGTVEVIIDITAFLSPGGGAAGPPGVSAPILLTDKAQYESATGDVTFNGIGWDNCSAINIDVFGGGGTDAGTNITPVGGTFTGRFPVPDAVGSFMLVATGSPSGPLCSALTVFRLVPPT